MTATLPSELRDVFERSTTAELVTLDDRGRPIARSVSPSYHQGGMCIDIAAGQTIPDPRVALLFAGSDPMVLVQGIAQAQDVLHIRPERVYAWSADDPDGEPRLFDAHLEEVRSGHDEEPPAEHAGTAGREPVWDERMDELGDRYPAAVLSLVAPDGFPFSARLPIEVDREARRVRLGGAPVGLPLQPGLACLTAHDHHPEFTWQRNFQVRGDLVQDGNAWALVPNKLVGGFELPPGSALARYRLNFQKMLRFRKKAKSELARREG
jgi:hypothetical protein